MKRNTLLKLGILLSVLLLVGCGSEKDSWNENNETLGNIEQNGEEKTENVDESNKNNENSNNNWDNYKGKTIADLIKDYPDLKDKGYGAIGDTYEFSFLSKDNKYYLKVIANCDSEKIDALGDIFDRETEDMYPYAVIERIAYYNNEELLNEAQDYVGKKIFDMVNDGYKVDGYMKSGDNVVISLHKGNSPHINVEIGEIKDFDKDNYKDACLDYIIKNVELSEIFY